MSMTINLYYDVDVGDTIADLVQERRHFRPLMDVQIGR